MGCAMARSLVFFASRRRRVAEFENSRLSEIGFWSVQVGALLSSAGVLHRLAPTSDGSLRDAYLDFHVFAFACQGIHRRVILPFTRQCFSRYPSRLMQRAARISSALLAGGGGIKPGVG